MVSRFIAALCRRESLTGREQRAMISTTLLTHDKPVTRTSRARKVPEMEQLWYQMQEWGLFKHAQCAGPDECWDELETFVRNVLLNKERAPKRKLSLTQLPENPIEAMKVIFREELQWSLYGDRTEVEDTLTTLLPDVPEETPPYRFDASRNRFVLREPFVRPGPSAEQISPPVRFRYKRWHATAFSLKQFRCHTFSHNVARRAIAAHTVCWYGSCVQCGESALRWTVCDDDEDVAPRFWKDICCMECGSTYAIMVAPTEAEMWLNMRGRRYVDGGPPFEAYHAVRRELPSGAAQFLVTISDEAKEDNEQLVWPIVVAKVETVLPFLTKESFEVIRDPSKNPKVYTRVNISEGTPKRWVAAPVFDYDCDAIAAVVVEYLENWRPIVEEEKGI